jgi:hypothetical protein
LANVLLVAITAKPTKPKHEAITRARTRNQESRVDHREMYNWYAIESDAEHRRLEWDRAVATDAVASQARPKLSQSRQAPLVRLSVLNLKLKQLVALGVSLVGSVASGQNTSSSYPIDQSCRGPRTNGA